MAAGTNGRKRIVSMGNFGSHEAEKTPAQQLAAREIRSCCRLSSARGALSDAQAVKTLMKLALALAKKPLDPNSGDGSS
jgi:hypothetical protein